MYKILLVDDERRIREGIKNNFPWEDMGFQIKWEASDGLGAVHILENNTPDVIFTDIVMHGMSGIELAKYIRCKEIPAKIIFLSGYRDFEYAREALSFKVSNYILKPIDPNELSNVFHSVYAELKNDPDVFTEEDDKNVYESLISEIKVFVRLNLASASLQSVAEHVSLSMSHLSRVFKTYYGTNFSEYLTSAKMGRAKELLSDRRKMVYEIAQAVGYDSAKNFTRAFKKFYGITPQDYRQNPKLLSGGKGQ